MTGGGERGLAVRCRPDGVVTEVICDDIGLTEPLEGRPFVVTLTEDSMPRGLQFLRALRRDGAAFGYDVDVAADDELVRMRLAGVLDDGELVVLCAAGEHGFEDVLTGISGINNELTNRLRELMKERPAADPASDTPILSSAKEVDALNELSQLNNELANMDRELARKTAQLEKLNRRTNEMIGMAVHDLRNPLGGIQGLAESLLHIEQGLDPRSRLMLEHIVASSDHMRRMVDDLLSVSEINAGQLRLDVSETDLAALVAEEVEIQLPRAEQKEIEITCDGLGSPVPAVVDADKIRQVVANLVSNAIKYSDGGTVVQVSLRERSDEVEIEVRDHGQGIAADEQSQLFQAFGRTSTRPTGEERSVGLGLVIVKRIVEGHGGRVGLDSTLGEGSTFTVALPLRPAGNAR